MKQEEEPCLAIMNKRATPIKKKIHKQKNKNLFPIKDQMSRMRPDSSLLFLSHKGPVIRNLMIRCRFFFAQQAKALKTWGEITS